MLGTKRNPSSSHSWNYWATIWEARQHIVETWNPTFVLKWRGIPPTGDPRTSLGAWCPLRASPCMKRRPDTLASIAAAAITKEAGDGEVFSGGLSETARTYTGRQNLCLSIMMLLAIRRISMMGVTMKYLDAITLFL